VRAAGEISTSGTKTPLIKSNPQRSTVHGFGHAFLGAIIISIVSILIKDDREKEPSRE
jgi:uncharacterized membrane protein YvlD (DUF360 family)